MLILEREYSDKGVIGQIYEDKNDFLICNSLERPWLNNMRMISCIPEGKYKIILSESIRFKKKMLRLLNVPNRSGILFHSGNIINDSNGCILAVSEISMANNRILGLHSVAAMNRLKTHIMLNYLDKNEECFIAITTKRVLKDS
jgi:hypothetical protein